MAGSRTPRCEVLVWYCVYVLWYQHTIMIIIIPRRLGGLALRIIKEELKLAIVDFFHEADNPSMI